MHESLQQSYQRLYGTKCIYLTNSHIKIFISNLGIFVSRNCKSIRKFCIFKTQHLNVMFFKYNMIISRGPNNMKGFVNKTRQKRAA